MWKWRDGKIEYVGCHNDRKSRRKLRQDIGRFLAEKLSPGLALAAHPVPESGNDTADRAREEAEERIRAFFAESIEILADLPGIKDIIEYSRSVHAEMDALLSAARNGVSPMGTDFILHDIPVP